jgi:peptide/nickel transport system substrate-binding protein
VVAHDKQTLTVMKKFDGYFLPFPANAPTEVRMSYSVEDATLRALMSRGQLDLSSMWHPNEVIADLAKLPGISAESETVYGEGLIKFNNHRPPMDNVHFRRAVAAAVDYDAIRSILKVTDKIQSGIPSRGPIPNGLPGSDPNGPIPKRDLGAAKKELAEAGYDPATAPPIEILSALCCALHQKIALLVSSNLAEVGVKTQIKEMPWAMVVESASKVESTPHITFVVQNLATPDVDSFLTETYDSSSAGSWSSMEWLQNKDVDKLISEGRTELDPAKRAAIYAQINKTILDLQPDAWAMQPANVLAKRNNIKMPFEDPKKATGLVAADFEFRLVQVE